MQWIGEPVGEDRAGTLAEAAPRGVAQHLFREAADGPHLEPVEVVLE